MLYFIQLKNVKILLFLKSVEQRYILFSYFFRNKTLTIEKEFFNKRKIITYNADIWLKAEKFPQDSSTGKGEGE